MALVYAATMTENWMVVPLRKSASVIAAVVIGVTSSGCGITFRTVAGSAITAKSVQTAPSTAPTGRGPSRDGFLDFVLIDTSSVQQVGDPLTPGLSMDAKGQFFIATLSIRNAGGTAVTFVDRDQMLVDSVGTRFSPSMAADIYANLGVSSTRILPGGELVVRIVFDVPVHTVPSSLVLRESHSSPGVTVPIG